jgi:hypothetical protein
MSKWKVTEARVKLWSLLNQMFFDKTFTAQDVKTYINNLPINPRQTGVYLKRMYEERLLSLVGKSANGKNIYEINEEARGFPYSTALRKAKLSRSRIS